MSPYHVIHRHCSSSTTLNTMRLVRTAINLYSFNGRYQSQRGLQPLGCWDQDFKSRGGMFVRVLCCSCVVLVVGCVGGGPCQELTCRSQRQLNGVNLQHGVWKCNVCGLYTADVMNVCHLCKNIILCLIRNTVIQNILCFCYEVK